MAEGTSINSPQALGEVYENGLVYSLSLRKVYCDIDDTKDNRLLWTSQIDRSVQYGTVPALIEHLAPSLNIDVAPSYRLTFLAVYRTFVTPDKLLQSLLERYVAVDSTDVQDNCQNKLRILKSLLSFVKLWLDKYTHDFIETPSLVTTIEEFLITENNPLLSQVLTELHTSVIDLKSTTSSIVNNTHQCIRCSHSSSCLCTTNETKTTISDDYKWSDKSSHQVAQDLTAYDAEIFRAVIPHQCLDYIRGQRTKANTVLKAINTFNTIVSQVIATVLQATNTKGLKTPSSRGKCISHWIDIAQHCRILKNFSSLLAIVSGLHSSSIYRLGKSWSSVNSEKKSILKELDELLSCDSNFQTFRDVLDKEATGKGFYQNKQSTEAVHGVIPYLGTILTDLTMLHTALPDVNKEGLINFDKRRKEFEILSRLSLYQTTAGKYVFTLDGSLIQWLHTTTLISDKESFDMSTELEIPAITTTSPKPSPSHLTLSSPPPPPPPPPCQFLLKKSLQLLTIAVHDVSIINPPGDSPPHYNSYHKNGTTTINQDDSSGMITRSNSSGDIRKDTVVVKVLPDNNTTYCNYKSIMINKSDHADSVIDKVLGKFDLPGSPTSYQLYQRLPNKKDISIPPQTVVYYALVINHKEPPILILKVKQ